MSTSNGWRLPQGWDLPQEGDNPDASGEPVNSVTEETTPTETTPETPVTEVPELTTGNLDEGVDTDLPEPTEPTEPTEPGEQVPFAVLNVYGQEIPVHSKKELINLAQQGVDYNSKMYSLRLWRQQIDAISKNNLLKEVVERAVKGEDVNALLVTAMSGKTEPTEPTNETEPDDQDESGDFKRYIAKQVEQAIKPQTDEIVKLKKLLFFEKLRASDPQYFDTVYGVMKDAYATPGALPDGMKQAIDSDPATFIEFYKSTRQAVLSRLGVTNAPIQQAPAPVTPLAETPKPATPEPVAEQQPRTEVRLRRQIQRPAVLESGRESQMDTQQRVLDEAEAIWDMPVSKFEELVKKNRTRYVHS